MQHPQPIGRLAQGHELTVWGQISSLHLQRAVLGHVEQPEGAILRGSQQVPPAVALSNVQSAHLRFGSRHFVPGRGKARSRAFAACVNHRFRQAFYLSLPDVVVGSCGLAVADKRRRMQDARAC